MTTTDLTTYAVSLGFIFDIFSPLTFALLGCLCYPTRLSEGPDSEYLHCIHGIVLFSIFVVIFCILQYLSDNHSLAPIPSYGGLSKHGQFALRAHL